MTENWYVVLELEFDPNPVTDERLIRQRIDEKIKFWSSKANDFNKGAEYRKYLDYAKKGIIENEMLGANNIRAELIRDAYDRVYGPIDETLRQIHKSDISADAVAKIAKTYKVSDDVVKRRVKVLGMKVVDYEATYRKYYLSKPQDVDKYNGIIPLLDAFHAEDLYDFLYQGTSVKNAQKLSCDALRQRASERKKNEFYKADGISGTGSKLCGLCEQAFKDNESKAVYDNYLEYAKRKAILDDVRRIYDLGGKLSSESSSEYIGRLTEVLKDRNLADEVFTAFCIIEDIEFAPAQSAHETATRNRAVSTPNPTPTQASEAPASPTGSNTSNSNRQPANSNIKPMSGIGSFFESDSVAKRIIILLVIVVVVGGALRSCVGGIARNIGNKKEAETTATQSADSNEQKDSGDGSEIEEQSDNEHSVTGDEIIVPPLEINNLAIEKLPQNPTSIAVAEIAVYNGSVSSEKQVDEYPFTAQYDGRYRIEISGLYNDTNVELHLCDENGEDIDYDTYCENGEGITAKELLAGHNYTVKIIQHRGFSDYSLAIGMQKETIDITGYTVVSDSVEYKDQRNVYTFKVPVDGRYRFEMSGMQSGTQVELYMFNVLGETVEYDSYCENDEGITVKDLKAGDEYQIQVRQKNEFSSYNLNIGYQKETIDITELSMVSDSIEYKDQRNFYTFKVPVDGRYRFELSGMQNDTEVELYMFNDLGETVESDNYCKNGEGITVKDLKAADEYTIQVRQKSGFSDYGLMIGKQKETVDVTKGSIVNDQIEYTDQRNVYSYTAQSDEDIIIMLSNMKNDMSVEVLVLNELEETLESDSYIKNGEGFTVTGVTTGGRYEIQVRQKEGEGQYVLTIE